MGIAGSGGNGGNRRNGSRPHGSGFGNPRPGAGQGRTGRSASGGVRTPGSRPSGTRPTVAPRPVSGRPGMSSRSGRYAPPPSPKRPQSYRRSGCANIAIGGVVVGIVLLIVLLNAIRSSCTGCAKDTDSDVSGFGSSTSSSTSGDSGSSTPSDPSVPDSSTSTSSFVPPKPSEPVIPVLTLVKNKPVKAFEADCVVDELQWFNDTKTTGESLKFVYDKLGIQPYVVFKKYDSSLKTDDDKVKYCVDWYKEHIGDDDTFLLMYFAEKASGADVGYTVYYSGANAEKLAVEFKWILEDGLNEYWFTEMSTDDVIKYAFEYTCDRITVKTEEIPPVTSSSDETPTTEEPSTTEETDDTTY